MLEAVDTALTLAPAPDPVHAHLSHCALPMGQATQGRALRVWAAASVRVMLAALGILLIVDGTSHISVFEILGASHSGAFTEPTISIRPGTILTTQGTERKTVITVIGTFPKTDTGSSTAPTSRPTQIGSSTRNTNYPAKP